MNGANSGRGARRAERPGGGGHQVAVVAGVQFLEHEDHRIVGKPDLRQCQQDPAAHADDRGRAALIVDRRDLRAADRARQRAGITVPRERVHQDGELILGHGRINAFALANARAGLVTGRTS